MKFTTAGLLAATFASTSLARILPATNGGLSDQAIAQLTKAQGKPEGENLDRLDGVDVNTIPGTPNGVSRAAVAPNAAPIGNAGWTATADSYQPGNEPQNAIDGNANTLWHTPWGADGKGLPHYLLIDMKKNYLINSIAYQPRQDGSGNGNIGGHTIQLSTDGVTFGSPKVLGTWKDDAQTKTSIFEATTARFVKLTATTEAGGRGPWSSVAELTIYQTTTAAPPYNGISGGEWSPTIDFPIVPVAAAMEYNSGNMLTWSSYAADTFGGPSGGKTLTSTYYPASQTVGQRLVAETGHDMFCPGLNMDSRGRVFVTGGNDAPKTSYYTPSTDGWTTGPQMNVGRGYQAQCTLSDGRTFVIGGSWSGGTGNKNGEVYSISQNAWTSIPGAAVAPMLTNDAQGVYRADNHAWLFGWKQGWVFQAGPSKQMNWYNANGNGATNSAGNRANDNDAMCGCAVMYDAVAGKILTVGGATSYQNVDATANAVTIQIGTQGQAVQSQGISGMYFQRIFHNAVVMPEGNVLIVGGQVYGQPFSDDTAQLTPEIWIAATGHFITLPLSMLPVGGGGLCGGCNTNHFDGQVYSPRYLFNADGSRAARPNINSATGQVTPGGTITATTSVPVSAWSLVRLGSTTHTVNTDQRRIPLTATNNGLTYTMVVPNDYGILIPGYYYLFAINGQGVPSVAKYVFVPR
ncbi:uncharacterized protein KY384_009027 [Bacidia gigantensis]|uniref:uncharacterized protein n=1 Tax=Bacidia gigantensis TaxID=2732470 RepID=UPI001D040876|nr:uncharacterized protein KY384_009027 [Bacidia gigantensis]KAG8525383.1 hypothetical protein KY384_009027 [Bacidia gigantensis]